MRNLSEFLGGSSQTSGIFPVRGVSWLFTVDPPTTPELILLRWLMVGPLPEKTALSLEGWDPEVHDISLAYMEKAGLENEFTHSSPHNETLMKTQASLHNETLIKILYTGSGELPAGRTHPLPWRVMCPESLGRRDRSSTFETLLDPALRIPS